MQYLGVFIYYTHSSHNYLPGIIVEYQSAVGLSLRFFFTIFRFVMLKKRRNL